MVLGASDVELVAPFVGVLAGGEVDELTAMVVVVRSSLVVGRELVVGTVLVVVPSVVVVVSSGVVLSPAHG